MLDDPIDPHGFAVRGQKGGVGGEGVQVLSLAFNLS
jgi:hypothetical protein